MANQITKNLMDTSIPKAFSDTLLQYSFTLAADHTAKILTTMVNGISDCLGDIKSKEYPVAYVIEETNLDFILGAVVEYHPNEDPSLPGNWSYIWTFDKSDIPENARVVTLKDVDMMSYFRADAAKKYSMGFETQDAFITCNMVLARTISNFLDTNAKEGEELTIVQDGAIQFRCAVEGGHVVKSAEPIGEVKVLIKGDADIEA